MGKKSKQAMSLQQFHEQTKGGEAPMETKWKARPAPKQTVGYPPGIPVGDKIRQRKEEKAAAKEDAVPGLESYLRNLRLQPYTAKAKAWCASMGAVSLEELAENAEDFADALECKPLERKRLLKALEEMDEQPIATAGSTGGGQRKSTAAGGNVSPNHVAQSNQWTFGPANAYRICEKLGSGTTCEVYKCMRGDQSHAVKVMSLKTFQLQPSFQLERMKLQEEARILGSLDHPNIVKLNDVVEEKDYLFLVLELVTGGELFDRIVGKGCFREPEAKHVFSQVIEAIAYIHSKGIVHRDLKPENILVRNITPQKDRTGQTLDMFDVAVADFGVAKLLQAGCSVARTYVGTPQYWAPEVRESGPMARGYDKRVDLWSLGVLLYVMVVGQYPFTQGDPTTSSKHVSRLTGAAKDIIDHLLQKDPNHRLPMEDCPQHPWLTGTHNGGLDEARWADWVPAERPRGIPEAVPESEEAYCPEWDVVPGT